MRTCGQEPARKATNEVDGVLAFYYIALFKIYLGGGACRAEETRLETRHFAGCPDIAENDRGAISARE